MFVPLARFSFPVAARIWVADQPSRLSRVRLFCMEVLPRSAPPARNRSALRARFSAVVSFLRAWPIVGRGAGVLHRCISCIPRRAQLARRGCAGIPGVQAAVSGCHSHRVARSSGLENIRRTRRRRGRTVGFRQHLFRPRRDARILRHPLAHLTSDRRDRAQPRAHPDAFLALLLVVADSLAGASARSVPSEFPGHRGHGRGLWKSSAPLALRFSALTLAAVLVNPHLFVYDLLVLAPVLLLLADWILTRSTNPLPRCGC